MDTEKNEDQPSHVRKYTIVVGRIISQLIDEMLLSEVNFFLTNVTVISQSTGWSEGRENRRCTLKIKGRSMKRDAQAAKK